MSYTFDDVSLYSKKKLKYEHIPEGFMITIEDINKVIEKIKNEHTKEYIGISINGDRGLNVSTSKFGGVPYIAQNVEVPVDAEGNQLALLAQINCTELPENDIYPKEGLLQFWISRDDSFGLFSKGTNVVKYIKDIDENIKNGDVLSKYHLPSEDNDEEYSPFQEKDASFALTFNKGISTITATDFLFEDIAKDAIHELFPNEKVEDLYENLDGEVYETLFKAFEGVKHAIGGYPTFVQWDPRNPDNKEEYNTMLLQVESEWDSNSKDNLIMWGDSGVANFFINKEKLANLDFEDVLFNWDCC